MTLFSRVCTLGFLALTALGYSQAPSLVVQTTHPRTSGRVALSDDHQYLATGDDDGTVKIWAVDSGQLLRTVETEIGIRQLGFDSQGRIVVAGSEKVSFLNPATGQEETSLQGSRILCTSFDCVDVTFITGDTAQAVNLWDLSSGSKRKTLVTMKDVVRNVRIAPDRKHVAVLTQDGSLTLFEYPDMKKDGGISGVAIDSALDFSPDSKLIAARSDSGVTVYKVSNRKSVADVGQTFSRRDPALFDADGNLYMRTQDGVTRFQPTSGGSGTSVFASVQTLLDFRISRDRKVGLITRLDDSIELYDLSSGQLMSAMRGVTGAVNAMASSGKYAATAADDGWLHLWNVSTGRPIASVLANPGGVSGVAFSSDGSQVMSVGADGMLRIWSVPSLAQVKGIQISGLPLRAIAASPNSSKVAVISYDGKLIVGDPSGSFAEVANLGSAGRVVVFTPDGQDLAAASGMGDLLLVSVDGGNERMTKGAHQSAITFIAFSKDKAHWVTAGLDGSVKFWQAGQTKPSSSTQLPSSIFAGAVTPDGSKVAIGGWVQPTTVFDISSGSKIKDLPEESKNTRTLAYSADGTKLLMGGRDGATEVWSASSNSLIARRYAMANREWVVVDSKGRFDGTDNGLKGLHWVQDNKPLELGAFFEQFDVPNLYASLTGAKIDPSDAAPVKPPPTPKIDITKKLSPPPLVKIKTPAGDQTSDQDQMTIEVTATDEGRGVDEISLFQNGKLVSNAQRNLIEIDRNAGNSVTKKFNVMLAPGANVFKATAYNKDRTESASPKEVRVTYNAPQPGSTLYILAVGINDYANKDFQLAFARPDSQAIATNLQAQSSGVFKDVVVKQVMDKNATKANIELAFAAITAKAKPGDAFVFFYSGHGIVTDASGDSPGQYYLVPADVKSASPSELEKLGISAPHLRDLCMAVPAQKQLVIFDACYSGGAREAFQSGSEQKSIHQFSRTTGVAVLAAASPTQTASELRALGHGVLTYAILKGIAGEAVNGVGSRQVSVLALFAYISRVVPDLTKQYRGQVQEPNVFFGGQDFPIAVSKGG